MGNPGLISMLVVVIVGGGLGFGLTFTIGKEVYRSNAVWNGPWATNLLQGSTAQDPYLRYVIGVWAVMALPREETIYFGAHLDNSRELLDCKYDYVLEGNKNIDTRWWSITVYDEDGWLIANPDDLYSINLNTVKADADGRYRVYLSRNRKEGNWLPLGESNHFQMIFRCYNPGVSIYSTPDKAELPKITRIREAGK
jgi:hypothetical protein